MHGGARNYLFDLGTGMYSSGSLPWFEEIYARRGITFDEVFGATMAHPCSEGRASRLLACCARSAEARCRASRQSCLPAASSTSLPPSARVVTTSLPKP